MKISSFRLFIIVFLTGLISCNTNKLDEHPIEGLWQGSYISDESGDNCYYSIKIKPDGTIEKFNLSGQKIGEGSWKLEGNIFCAKYCCPNGTEYSIVASSVCCEEKKIFGLWGYDDNATNGGTWEMQKK